MPEEAFDQAAASGVINPEMTREDAKSLNVSATSKRRVIAPPPLPASLLRDSWRLSEKLEMLDEAVNDLRGAVISSGSDAEDASTSQQMLFCA